MTTNGNRMQITYPDKLDGKNWNLWKRCMLNVFTIQGLRSVVEEGFEVIMVTTSDTDKTPKICHATELNITSDVYSQNLILTHMMGSLSVLVDGCETSHKMWRALLDRFEGNDQMKRTKLMGLEQLFDSFRMNEGESVDDMYSRMNHIKNGFTALGESFTNSQVVGIHDVCTY